MTKQIAKDPGVDSARNDLAADQPVIRVDLAPTHPDATPDEIRAFELPVTEVQTQNAQEEAADRVEEKTDARVEEAKRKALRDAQNPPPAPSPGDMAADQVDQAREGVEQAERQAAEEDLTDEQAAIPGIKGEPITVDEIATVEETETPATIAREDGE